MNPRARILLLIALAVVAVNSEPQNRFRSTFRVTNARQKFARQELPLEEPANAAPAPPQTSEAPAAAASGPYPPSGWKPSGRAFPLPTEKEAEPDNSYGPPDNTYGPPETTTTPPDTSYGPPENTYGPPDNTYGPPEEQTTEAAQELAPYPASEAPSGPYPPTGWKPSGRAFPLPSEQDAQTEALPDQAYGPPENSYGPPDNTYGPPDSTVSTEPEIDDDAVVVDATFQAEPEAFFYVRLPNGNIQKVTFNPTKPAVEQFRVARLRQSPRKGPSFVAKYIAV